MLRLFSLTELLNRAPTLDTVNRSCRQIEQVLLRYHAEIDRLSRELAKLDLKPIPKKLPQVVPHVSPETASTTAAALNAESAAQKFKSALLATRNEPRLVSVTFALPDSKKAAI